VCIFGFRVVLLGYMRLSALLMHGVQHLGTYFILKLDAVCCMFIRGCARRIVCAKVVKKYGLGLQIALELRSFVAEECRCRLSIAPVHYLRPFSGRGRCPGVGQMSEPNVRSPALAPLHSTQTLATTMEPIATTSEQNSPREGATRESAAHAARISGVACRTRAVARAVCHVLRPPSTAADCTSTSNLSSCSQYWSGYGRKQTS